MEGLEAAREEVRRLSARAEALLASLPGERAFLEQIIHMLITREK